jgi:hypothetical protein
VIFARLRELRAVHHTELVELDDPERVSHAILDLPWLPADLDPALGRVEDLQVNVIAEHDTLPGS